MKRTTEDIMWPKFFKELGCKQVIFGVKQSIFFWQFQKQFIYFQQGNLFILSKMGNILFISIFSSTPPQISNGPPQTLEGEEFSTLRLHGVSDVLYA